MAQVTTTNINTPQSEPTTATEPYIEPIEAYISEDEAKAFIYMHESSNRLDAVNTSSGACGLGQRLPCQTLINECPDWKTNYACQDNHFTNYMLNRYGSWIGAYNFWQEHNWW